MPLVDAISECEQETVATGDELSQSLAADFIEGRYIGHDRYRGGLQVFDGQFLRCDHRRLDPRLVTLGRAQCRQGKKGFGFGGIGRAIAINQQDRQ